MTPSLQTLAGGAQTLGELFEAKRNNTRDLTRFVHDFKSGFPARDNSSLLVSREEQWGRAALAAGALKKAGVACGDYVVILLPTGEDFIAAFFACQLLGAIPVPLVPPWSLDRIESHLSRIAAVCRICRPKVSVISSEAIVAISTFSRGEQGLDQLGILLEPEELKCGQPVGSRDPGVKESAPAMVQFTSGSTAEPRGVVLSHRALLANCYAIGQRLEFWRPEHVGCSWLPLFHDMGLIGHVLVPLLWSIPNVLLPPESFVLRPESWLEAISAYRATISTAPNFAYQMCSQRLREDKIVGLDLSRWSVALCGGEPVHHASLNSFVERFTPVGFRATALCPVYGLAEFSLAMSLSSPHLAPLVDAVDRDRFAVDGVAVPAVATSEVLHLVSSGEAAADHEIRIVDDQGDVVEETHEGQIQGRGPSLMSGYLNDSAATEQAIRDGWLNTGDRGYLRNGQLFVTGRSKEVIIKGGKNFYPQEIERAAGLVAGVREGRVVAFGLVDEEAGTDAMIVLCETRETAPEKVLQIEIAVMGAIRHAVGLRPDEVVMLAQGTLTKTSSGKLQRLDARRRYLEGELSAPRRATFKLAKLWLARSKHRLEKVWRT